MHFQYPPNTSSVKDINAFNGAKSDLVLSFPTTERSNPLTENIDLANAFGIVSKINQCEREIFGNSLDGDGILNTAIIKKCSQIAEIAQNAAISHPIQIALVGAGTSGRLCRLIAQIFEKMKVSNIEIVPVIAGGISALVRTEPNTEDNFQQGYQDYSRHHLGRNVLAIGISCGLSSHYVRGFLAAAQESSSLPVVLMGFNKVSEATIKIEMEEYPSTLIVINPLIGPEPIAGSVRMKGGTATILLLSAILSKIFFNLDISSFLTPFIKILHYSDNCKKSLAELVIAAGNALISGKSINYLGDGIIGVLGAYDSAECCPTFGAFDGQVNAYLYEGWHSLRYFQYEDCNSHLEKVSFSRINVRTGDFNLLLSKNGLHKQLSNNSIGDLWDLQIAWNNLTNDYLIHSETPVSDLGLSVLNTLREVIICRSYLTHISTGAFTIAGKIFQNTMIDLRITNRKLFNRAVRIVNQLTNEDSDLCRQALKVTIADANPNSGNVEDTELIISLAAKTPNVIPKTILKILLPTKSFREIDEILSKEPRVRQVVHNHNIYR